ncbi:MAG: tRNA uridine-5-carboxymethylaminomethyl(34) synthesis GTPase MnmE [Chitinophagaceae bacterium]|nr:tRNA uridine-5-carboxymethylaminomethyl(34) synthesis GTPase MnmE [Chitinophagaceae bacterium]
MIPNETIVAIATAPGIGAIGVVRLSGSNAINVADAIFIGKKLRAQGSHTIHFGRICDSKNNIEIDEVVVSIFKNPKSYTGEDVVEISGHGAPFVLQQIVNLCIAEGARPALAGEFTQRAFLNGKMDLAQAEAVADLIAANSLAAQQTALKQLRGGISSDLKTLREQLINFAALIELELDFGEEDVDFADRSQLGSLIDQLKLETQKLIQSFELGNAIKNGVSVAIIGKPNAGKSTLLNALLNEDRAIVSDIAGTTRDTIEEVLNINGILFRLIDTAGIRHSKGDTIEDIGIERSKANAEKADIIIHLHDMTEADEDTFEWLSPFQEKVIDIFNKYDQWEENNRKKVLNVDLNSFGNHISAKNKEGIEMVKQLLFEKINKGVINTENTIVTNIRHRDALQKLSESLAEIESAMHNNISGELLAIDIRRSLYFLGSITGEVEIDRDILGTIFGKFCIGK